MEDSRLVSPASKIIYRSPASPASPRATQNGDVSLSVNSSAYRNCKVPPRRIRDATFSLFGATVRSMFLVSAKVISVSLPLSLFRICLRRRINRKPRSKSGLFLRTRTTVRFLFPSSLRGRRLLSPGLSFAVANPANSLLSRCSRPYYCMPARRQPRPATATNFIAGRAYAEKFASRVRRCADIRRLTDARCDKVLLSRAACKVSREECSSVATRNSGTLAVRLIRGLLYSATFIIRSGLLRSARQTPKACVKGLVIWIGSAV